MLGRYAFVKGQTLLEIVTFIGVVSLVILTMQVYMQRGLQGKTKDLTDEIINPENLAQKAYTAESSHSIEPSKTTSDGIIRVSADAGGYRTKKIEETTHESSNTWSKSKP